MLSFETLLVKELQKQQCRAEFCDVVLQTEGVSVPVHSCVLSAFSPWLCGTLLTMPSPRNGQRRLIEVPAMEACTLLSLVSLIYSGQLSQDKEEVLSAACKLGINIPQEETKKISKVPQKESMTKGAEKACQTETDLSGCNIPKEQVVETVWRNNQELCTFSNGSEITVTTLPNLSCNPDSVTSLQIMDVVTEGSVFPSVSGDIPQVYACPPGTTYQLPSCTSAPSFPPTTYAQHLSNHGEEGANLGGEENVLETFARFENNIPGFINYFINTNLLQKDPRHRRGQGDGKTERRPRRLRGGMEGFNLKGKELNIWKSHLISNRGGVTRLTRMGQGGGRVGRLIDSRKEFKNHGRRTRQVREVAIKEGVKGRSSSRGRQRGKRGRGKGVVPQGQGTVQGSRRRGRPRKHPLPSISEPKTLNPPVPNMIGLPAVNQINLSQQIDCLIDDVIAQLPSMPSNQHDTNTVVGSMESTKPLSTIKLSDLSTLQPQTEGELTDILDHFLRTFEQQVEECDADCQDDMMSSVNEGDLICGNTAINRAFVNPPADTQRLSRTHNTQVVHRPQKPSKYWKHPGVINENSSGLEGEEEPLRLTRSQSRKRKLLIFEDLLRSDQGQRKRRRDQLEKAKEDGILHGAQKDVNKETKQPSSTFVTNALRKVIKRARVSKKKTLVNSPEQSETQESSQTNEEKACLRKKAQSFSEERMLNVASTTHSQTMNTSNVSQPPLSALELVKNLFDNQKREKVQTGQRRRRARRKKRGRVGFTRKGSGTKDHQEEHPGERKTDAGEQLIQLSHSEVNDDMSGGEILMEDCSSPIPPQSLNTGCDTLTQIHTFSTTHHHDNFIHVDSSDEDVDVVELSDSVYQCFPVLQIPESNMVEEDSEEDEDVDVISVGYD